MRDKSEKQAVWCHVADCRWRSKESPHTCRAPGSYLAINRWKRCTAYRKIKEVARDV